MEINYAVLMPPPKRSAKKLQLAILGGVGFVALTAIVVAIVLVRAYSPQAATLGSQGPTSTLATAVPAPAVTPTPVPSPSPAAAPAAVDQEKDGKAVKGTKKRVGRRGQRARAAGTGKDTGSAPAKPKKKADDELKKLLGI